jgi:predicted AAA+ superfamily ATPase
MGEKARYVSLDDVRFNEIDNVLDEILKWNGDEGHLLLDEITSIPGWDGWLYRVHEMTKGKLHLVVTSSRQTIRRPSRQLRGRVLRFDVHPLSFRERLDFLGISIPPTTAGKGMAERELTEHMQFGGFPEVVLANGAMEKRSILAEYYHDILGLDVAAATGTDPAIVELFGRYLLRSPMFSASSCHSFLKCAGHKIGKEKVLELEAAAAESMLFHFCPVFAAGVKAPAQMPRKAFSGDLGLLGALLAQGNEGRRLENMVFLEMLYRLEPLDELRYWKGPGGEEVDILHIRGMDVIRAVQVCLDLKDSKTLSREVDGLMSCSRRTGVNDCQIITIGPSRVIEQEGVHIEVIDALEWLCAP